MYQHEIYQGIESMIKKLYEQGKKLIVATSKQEEFAKNFWNMMAWINIL